MCPPRWSEEQQGAQGPPAGNGKKGLHLVGRGIVSPGDFPSQCIPLAAGLTAACGAVGKPDPDVCIS